jgi:DNA-binding transcriptional regulator YiaG
MSGAALLRLRKRLGLTQVLLAAQLRVDENTVRRWEKGRVGISAAAARLIGFVAAETQTRKRRGGRTV